MAEQKHGFEANEFGDLKEEIRATQLAFIELVDIIVDLKLLDKRVISERLYARADEAKAAGLADRLHRLTEFAEMADRGRKPGPLKYKIARS